MNRDNLYAWLCLNVFLDINLYISLILLLFIASLAVPEVHSNASFLVQDSIPFFQTEDAIDIPEIQTDTNAVPQFYDAHYIPRNVKRREERVENKIQRLKSTIREKDAIMRNLCKEIKNESTESAANPRHE